MIRYKNPYRRHTQADLFGGETTARHHVPVADLSEKELEGFNVEDFDDEEWAALPDEVMVAIVQRQAADEEWDIVDLVKAAGYRYGLDVDNSAVRGKVDDLWDCLDEDAAVAVTERRERSRIGDKIWALLPKQAQEYVEEHNPENKADAEAVDALVDWFMDRYNAVTEPDDDYVLEAIDADYFSSWLGENSDELVDYARRRAGSAREVNEILEEIVAMGADPLEAERIVNESMNDADKYDTSVTDKYSYAFFKDSTSVGYLYVDQDKWKKQTRGMSEASVEKALDEIAKKTDLRRDRRPGSMASSRLSQTRASYGSLDLLLEGRDLEVDLEVQVWVAFEPDWDRIHDAAIEIAEGKDFEATAKPSAREWGPPESRILKKWKDGFYIQELAPTELAAESKEMGHCIGKTRAEGGYDYPEMCRAGKGRAFALKTSSGRTKIDLWADVDKKTGDVLDFSQAKGKANRLLGWDLSQAGYGKVKQDEVEKTFEFMAELGVNPLTVSDAQPAAREVFFLAAHPENKASRWAQGLLKKIEAIPGFSGLAEIGERFQRDDEGAEARAAARAKPKENPARACPTCGGEIGGFCAAPRANPPAKTWTDERGYERGECLCGMEPSFHPDDACGGLSFCPNCNQVTCASCRDDDEWCANCAPGRKNPARRGDYEVVGEGRMLIKVTPDDGEWRFAVLDTDPDGDMFEGRAPSREAARDRAFKAAYRALRRNPPATRRGCSSARHDELKADEGAWRRLIPAGEQHMDDLGIHLELRNCPDCRSTLARPLPGHVDE